MKIYIGKLSTFLICFIINFVIISSSSRTEQLRSMKFPPCRACKTLVDSFEKGMKKTAKGKFEGGDAAWEEEKLGSYSKSEIRLVEIQENLCKDIEEGRDQCFTLAEQHDNLLEEWWFKHQSEHSDLQSWLCIEKLELCCPENHFGPKCLPCPGYPDKICSKNGKCKGAGTRKGNGQCVCDPGYEGENCLDCQAGYYASYKDENKLLCSKCHQSCLESCTEAGSKGCTECAPGWIKDPAERGCLDVNECVFEKSPCSSSQFCVNTDGSYRCLNCDKACSGCTGDGPDMCNSCALGYILKDNICVDSSQHQRTAFVNFTRYLTYVGLCVATCIIFQRNVTVAAVVGLAVALYISVSEYMLSTGAAADHIIDPDNMLKSIR